MSEVLGVLASSRAARRDAEWEQFSSMPSTAFAATVFKTPAALHSVLLEASRFGSLGVRATVLAISGALATSYFTSRLCLCGSKFSFSHFLSCEVLGPCRVESFALAVECEDWREATCILLSRFEVYLHAIRGGELRGDESDLFDLLNAQIVGDVSQEGFELGEIS